jgi:hypothetical protein
MLLVSSKGKEEETATVNRRSIITEDVNEAKRRATILIIFDLIDCYLKLRMPFRIFVPVQFVPY